MPPDEDSIVKGRNIAAEDVERLAEDVAGLSPGRAVAFGVPDQRLGSERIVLVVEAMRGSSEEQLRAADQTLRRRVVEALDVILGGSPTWACSSKTRSATRLRTRTQQSGTRTRTRF
jgi:hypothetical protein